MPLCSPKSRKVNLKIPQKLKERKKNTCRRDCCYEFRGDFDSQRRPRRWWGWWNGRFCSCNENIGKIIHFIHWSTQNTDPPWLCRLFRPTFARGKTLIDDERRRFALIEFKLRCFSLLFLSKSFVVSSPKTLCRKIFFARHGGRRKTKIKEISLVLLRFH